MRLSSSSSRVINKEWVINLEVGQGGRPANHGRDWIIKNSFERILLESRIPMEF